MQYFTIQARSHWEAIDKMKSQYGSSARPMTCRNIRYGGVLGLFQKEGVEMTCFIPKEVANQPLEEQKRKIIESAGKSQALTQILDEIRSLKQNIQVFKVDESELHQSITKIRELLVLNDFSASYIEGIITRLKTEFPLETLNDFSYVQAAVVEWIAEAIKIHPPPQKEGVGPCTITIIGPTGVGKTTTIAKLAAVYGLGGSVKPQVRIITIDNYKIAAKQQIETYAKIMQIPIAFAETGNDLEKTLGLYQDADFIFIDTIGKSPHDLAKLGEMQAILKVCKNGGETHLAISATTKTSDIEEVLRQFEPFNYCSIILTKLDETSRIGNIISVLAERRKSVSYITDGQIVPHDIESASVARLLAGLEGFKVDKEKIAGKFDLQNVDN